jgi:hypothetical protein
LIDDEPPVIYYYGTIEDLAYAEYQQDVEEQTQLESEE